MCYIIKLTKKQKRERKHQKEYQLLALCKSLRSYVLDPVPYDCFVFLNCLSGLILKTLRRLRLDLKSSTHNNS